MSKRSELLMKPELAAVENYDKDKFWTAWRMEQRLEMEDMLRKWVAGGAGEVVPLDLIVLGELLHDLDAPR